MEGSEDSIGFRIRAARRWRGMSQAELARRIRISANSLNGIELGHTKSPRGDVVRRIAQALQVSGDYLLGLRDELPPKAASVDLVVA